MKKIKKMNTVESPKDKYLHQGIKQTRLRGLERRPQLHTVSPVSDRLAKQLAKKRGS